jgi:hypothetical protein
MGSGGVRQPYRDPPDTRQELVGFCGGGGTGLSVFNPWDLPSQSQVLACTGSVAMIARASTAPAITMVFDFMGRLLLRDEDLDHRIQPRRQYMQSNRLVAVIAITKGTILPQAL